MSATPLLTPFDVISDNVSLDNIAQVHSVTVGSRSFVYAAAPFSDRIAVYEVFPDAAFGAVAVYGTGDAPGLNGVGGFTSATINGTTYLYASGQFSDGITIWSVASDGTLTLIDTVLDTSDPLLELDGALGEMLVVERNGKQFLVAHGATDNGISVFEIENDGTLTNRFNVDDASALGLGLDGVLDTAVAQIGNRTYVFAVGRDDDAISVLRLSNSGQLTLANSIQDDFTTEINGARGVEAVTIDGTTYLYVIGEFDAGLSVFSVNNQGVLTNLQNIADTIDIALNGPQDLDTFRFNDTDYMVVTSRTDDGVTLFEIGADGLLTEASTVFDSELGLNSLDGASASTFVEVAGQGFLVVGSAFDDALTLFQVDARNDPITGTPDDDILIGTTLDDVIEGSDGDDLLVGDAGADTLNGGENDDIIIAGDGDDLILGDGDLSQTVSSATTVTETGQDLALNVTLPDSSDGSRIEISGLINRDPLDSSEFNIVYVIDVSGSMADPFQGNESVGDLNNNGISNTLLDGTIAAFDSLNQSIVDAGFGTADVSIVTFNSSAATAFSGFATGGVRGALEVLRSGGGTNFEAALQQSITALQASGAGQNQVYFISDGGNNTGGSVLDEVATLTDPNGLDAEIFSIGLGNGAVLPDLDLVDDGVTNLSVERVLEPSTLTAGLLGSPVDTTEVDRIEVFVNGQLKQTIDDTELVQTPLGLQYDVTVRGLSTSSGDVIDVVLVASDTAETEVAVSITVPNAPQSPGDDVLLGEDGDDVIDGNGGDDLLVGGNGNDGLSGSAGEDTLKGGKGNDQLLGGSGNDVLIGGAGRDTMRGGLGDDSYHVGRRDVLDESGGGRSDFDTILGRINIDLGSADFIGSFEGATLLGTADLFATGVSSANLLIGNVGDNTLIGLGGADTLLGGDGRDSLVGGSGNDSAEGGRGSDTLKGGGGRDILTGDSGRDALRGDKGNDTLNGGGSTDTLDGGSGNDLLDGGSSGDRLVGGSGNDTLIGGAGNDTLIGNSGNDQFVFVDGHGDDRVEDFAATSNSEDIDLSGISSIGSMSQLQNAATQVGSDVVIDTGGGNSITLVNVDLSDLGTGDFLF